jgi:hypothetical protein
MTELQHKRLASPELGLFNPGRTSYFSFLFAEPYKSCRLRGQPSYVRSQRNGQNNRFELTEYHTTKASD